jgi:hypothetical protein
MDITGHTTVEFDKSNPVALKEAMDRFADLTGKGYLAAKTIAPGQHEKINAFDPDADTLFQPHMVGG